jgi:hypothetical protein
MMSCWLLMPCARFLAVAAAFLVRVRHHTFSEDRVAPVVANTWSLVVIAVMVWLLVVVVVVAAAAAAAVAAAAVVALASVRERLLLAPLPPTFTLKRGANNPARTGAGVLSGEQNQNNNSISRQENRMR